MRYEIRELDVGGILDQAIKLTKDHFWLFVKITLVLLVPFSVITGLLLLWNMPDVPAAAQPAEVAREIRYGWSPMVWTILAITNVLNFVFILPLTDAALIYAIENCYLEKPTGVGIAYQRALHIFLPLVGTWIVMGLAIASPMILAFIVALAVGPVGFIAMPFLGIFSLILAFWFMLAPRVVVIEGIAGTGALNRSKRLMKGNTGTAFVLGIVVFIIGALCGGLPRFIPQRELEVVVRSVLQAGLSFFAAAAWVVFYFSCRCKAEHFDLTMLADSVAAEEPPPPQLL
jgi:hypothetical protein